MLNCSWEHSSARQKQVPVLDGKYLGNEMIDFLKWNGTDSMWLRSPRSHGMLLTVSVLVFARVYSCVIRLARDKLLFFSTYFLPTRFFPLVLVPFLPSRGLLASPNLPSVHALPCQVALDVPCGAGFTYFGVFCGFPLFLDVRRSWFCTLNYQLWFFFLKSF